MYLKKATVKKDGKTYDYYQLVASYRDKNGKPKNRMVQYLGALSDKDVELYKMILKAQRDPRLTLVKSDDIVIEKHFLFLPIILLHSLWEKFDLQRFFPNSLMLEALVLNRCINPQTKIRIVEWASGTVLPAIYDSSLPDEFAVYRELDALNKKEHELQTHIYRQLERIDPTVQHGFYYDITSSYMEGSKCVIAKLGYSRDHRPDLKQVVIALMVTPSGSPFYWKVLEGNTQDVTTITDLVKELKSRFGLKTCHLVFDRGMVSEDNLKLLEDESLTYLSAMDKDEMARHPLFQKFMPEPAAKEDYEQIMALHEFQPTDENQFFYTREEQIDKRRYIFSFDVSRFYADIACREKRISQGLDWIAEQNKKLREAKKSRSRETLERAIKIMLSKRKLKSFLKVTINPIEVEVKKDEKMRVVQSFQLSSEIDRSGEYEIRRMDGITCFITNDVSIPQTEIIQRYRDKNKVEEAFAEIKSQLSLRPFYLTRPERVKAHVSICVLAYLFMNTIEMMLKQAGIIVKPKELLEQLKLCYLNKVRHKNSSDCALIITEMNEQQSQVMKLLQCEKYLDPKEINKITSSIKKAI